MSTGAWAFGLAIANSAMTGVAQAPPVLDGSVNPLAACFKTSDGRWLNFTMMQPSRYFADFCRHLDLAHLIEDERFKTFETIMANARVAAQYFREAIAAKPFAYWLQHLDTLEGQWAPVQDPVEIASDPQMAATGYLVDVIDADGKPRKLVANPVQFDETTPNIIRAPLFAEHTDDLLSGLGRSEEEIIEMKIAGAVT
jgi:crotonobetainyl-CoA:carnitine CoA-transferase CaiB-like acyl-CoA transferase